MNHAERVKELAKQSRELKALHIGTRDRLDGLVADERFKELFTAIDAMQSALDEAVAKLAARDAEIERLRIDLDVRGKQIEMLNLVLSQKNHEVRTLRNLRCAASASQPEAALSEEVKGGE